MIKLTKVGRLMPDEDYKRYREYYQEEVGEAKLDGVEIAPFSVWLEEYFRFLYEVKAMESCEDIGPFAEWLEDMFNPTSDRERAEKRLAGEYRDDLYD
jgi:hypothetical protein